MPGGFVPYHHDTGKPYKAPNPIKSATSGVKGLSQGVQQGSVSSGSVPASSYGGKYASYAPSSTKSTSKAKSASRSRQVKRAKQARQKVAKQRKARSGQDVKLVKSQQKKLKAVAPKKVPVPKARMMGKVKAPVLQVKMPKKGPSMAFQGTAAVNEALRLAKAPAPKTPPKPKAVTHKPKKVAVRLEKAVSKAKPTFSGLDSEQSKVLGTVLKQGTKAGAGKKVLLSAVETGLVESGLRNLDYGDADSQGWRQERSMYYPNPTNVKASAKRYFSEASEAKAPGMSPGNVAQAAQQSAFPERYDAVEDQAKPLLEEYLTTRKESVPKKLKQTAKQTLGKKPTKAILRGGKVVKDPKAGEKTSGTFKGRYAGSQDMVRAIVGSKVKGDHGGTKSGEAPGVHSATGDHYRDDGYAQDINGMANGENEPAYNQESLDAIVKNLRDLGAKDVPDLKIGENWEGNVGGYYVQVLTNEGGTINHIHVGAHPGGEGGAITNPNIPIKGTKLAVKVPSPTSAATSGVTTFTGAVSGFTATGSTSATTGSSKSKKAVRRRRARQAYTPYADNPGGYYSINPDDYAADPFLKRLAELTQ